MKIKRFVAKDMRSALAEVKEFLGPDAIILSNKKVAEGVEIVAAIDAEPATSSKPAANARVEDITPLTKRAEPKVNIRIDDQAEAEPADSLRALLARQMLSNRVVNWHRLMLSQPLLQIHLLARHQPLP